MNLGGLNERQMEAVSHKDGPLLIIAGAGAGKTKTITHRILNLIASGVAPSEILAITFTNKAAREMSDRVSDLLRERRGLRDEGEKPFISTFHFLGIQILRENSRELNLPRRFSIFDADDSLRAVKEALKENNLDPKQFEPGRLRSVISRYKGDMITLEEFSATADDYFPKTLSRVWASYEKIKKREKALDFDDLILRTALLLERNKKIREHYQKRFRFIHVDEYQDTNQSQYEITKLLSEGHRNICVVGDSDQNIYGWRGANLRNLLNFEKDYPEAKVVLLEENYRSTKIILDAANRIIKKNKIRKEKNLFTQKEVGEKISVYSAFDEGDESRFVAEKSKDLIGRGVSPKEIAVLYRANFQSRVMEEAFLNSGIPYQVLGVKFFERKEVKDILSYIRASLEENFSDLKRIFNSPPRGIGQATVAKIFSGKENALPPKTLDKIKGFRKSLAKIKEAVLNKKASEAVKYTIEESGLGKSLTEGGDEERERYENLMELVSLAVKYDLEGGGTGMEHLLDDAALASDQDTLERKKGDAVRLMTVHASKGLEFRHVFITGLEADLFPHRRLQSAYISEEDSEEERRLFYVALTRAKEKLYLTFTELRTIFGSRQVNAPSEFLSDVGEDLVHFEERVSAHRVVYLD